ncbi:antibiotic biosynthesis monooxygenase [soil metagenome]
MILEVALIDVAAGSEEAFIAAYGQAKAQILAADGMESVRMTQGIETPSRFVLLVEWDSVDAHDAFRASPGFAEWRALIGPHFATSPQVEHFTDLH